MANLDPTPFVAETPPPDSTQPTRTIGLFPFNFDQQVTCAQLIMSKKKQQKNGFFYYMLDMQQELRQQGRSISMREMPIFAGPSWSKLSDAQKQMYNLRAKQEKAKISGASANGGATALGASNPVVPGRRDCSGTLISVSCSCREGDRVFCL